ncbi:hypothetical protein [Chitinilyticum piscinae]|uniref:Uncharacterized protein n=1 Tax=Chitinilyticum piscinae TaxID=2866724 RepID=A0A8J7FI68_9NEIS|nr:hypothetical protein [Chitinilyticum piscinae]MBE9609903.1 hypothetical protein [Chitinilyticum piscinae]
MRKHVKAISDGYQAWLDLLPRVRRAVGNGDAGQLNKLKAEMNSVEEDVRTAEKGIFEFARIKGYKVEQ